jgi:integrase
MPGQGVILKRCGCRDAVTRKRLAQHCPRLPERGHGTWYFHASAPDHLGRIHRARRGGYPNQASARQARDEWLAQSGGACTAQSWTLAAWLAYWLSTRTRIRPTTRAHYTRDVERFLAPHLGQTILADLDLRRLRAGFTAIAATRNGRGQPQSAACLQHLRTTLRAALNLAVREGVLDENPVHRLDLPARPRPHAQVWTDGRVRDWQAGGPRPAVAVWIAAHLADFLDHVATDALYAMWRLVALRGLRRGEACGLRWSDLDLDHAVAYITRSRTCVGYQVLEGPPKTQAGERVVALDKLTARILRAHRAAQLATRDWRWAAGQDWADSGYVFTQAGGLPIHPGYATQRFRILTAAAGLPPIRLHDLRHTAASLAHEAGMDLKVIQDQLGHASILTTADTYTSVLPAAQRRCAERTARLVQKAAHRTRSKIKAKARRNKHRGGEPSPRPAGHPPADPKMSDAPRPTRAGRAQQCRSPRPGPVRGDGVVTTGHDTHVTPTPGTTKMTSNICWSSKRARRDSNP